MRTPNLDSRVDTMMLSRAIARQLAQTRTTSLKFLGGGVMSLSLGTGHPHALRCVSRLYHVGKRREIPGNGNGLAIMRFRLWRLLGLR